MSWPFKMMQLVSWPFKMMQSRSPSVSYSKSASFNRRSTVNTGSPRARLNLPSAVGWFSRIQILPFVVGFLVTFLVAICAGYSLVVPSLRHTFHLDNPSVGTSSNSSVSVCNVFYGSWVQDESYPLYNASECPFAEQGFNCLANGRNDGDYLKLRWKPRDCDIPKLSVKEVLEWFRNRRIVFVGDSMSRTQWESLICFLLTGVEDKTSVYEVNGNKITKQIRFLGVRFNSFNFTVEFFRSVFLVQQGWKARHSPKRVRSVLRLDKLDDISNQWIDSDVLIFNTGQWWVPGKLFDTGCYFQVGDSLKLGMSISTAFGAALNTWASWIDQNIDRNKTKVLIRTFEPSHWSDQTRKFCNVTQYPSLETEGRDKNILSDIVMETVKKMKDPVSVLNITSMSSFRSDAHVGFWSDKPFVPDCSHWCLPGVPDMWNEILLSYLLDTSHNLSGH